MMVPEKNSSRGCHVFVTPSGALHWLAQPHPSLQRTMIEVLLDISGRRATDVRALSEMLKTSVPEVTRALFALIHTQAVRVETSPPAAVQHEVAVGVQSALTAVAADVGAVVADRDGLCIAANGLSDAEADRCASQVLPAPQLSSPPSGRSATLYFGSGPVTIWLQREADWSRAGWSLLATSLLRLCGPLSSTLRLSRAG